MFTPPWALRNRKVVHENKRGNPPWTLRNRKVITRLLRSAEYASDAAKDTAKYVAGFSTEEKLEPRVEINLPACNPPCERSIAKSERDIFGRKWNSKNLRSRVRDAKNCHPCANSVRNR